MPDQTDRWQCKIDHRLLALWARVEELDRGRRSINVFLRVTRSDDLERLGVRVHTMAGDIATGSMMLVDLPRVANAAATVFVELAAPLRHDGDIS